LFSPKKNAARKRNEEALSEKKGRKKQRGPTERQQPTPAQPNNDPSPLLYRLPGRNTQEA
jgi:hypothetical protein